MFIKRLLRFFSFSLIGLLVFISLAVVGLFVYEPSPAGALPSVRPGKRSSFPMVVPWLTWKVATPMGGLYSTFMAGQVRALRGKSMTNSIRNWGFG